MAEVNRRIFIRKRDREIARIIEGYTEKTIVFCPSIPYAGRMKKHLRLSAVFHSSTGKHAQDTWNKNKDTLSKLNNGLIRRICAINAFNEGVNVPTVGLVAFCRVTGSLTIFRQQLGRGLRPGKDKLIVLDFVGNLERIQLILEMMNKISDLHEQYTSKEGRAREGYERQRFEVSGAGFQFTFSDKVVDLMKVLEHCEREFYPTWQEASRAAIALGFNNMRSYHQDYREDPRLPSEPRMTYIDYPGDSIFFGREKRNLYATWEDASRAARSLGITSNLQYRARSHKDSRLPGQPERYEGFPGWFKFLAKEKRVPYRTLEEAKRAAKRLKIKSSEDYLKRYKADSRLPSSLRKQYAKQWKGWRDFLQGRSLYPTIDEASGAARRLKFQTRDNYMKNYKRDPRLPSVPKLAYKEVWNRDGWDWDKFLGKKN